MSTKHYRIGLIGEHIGTSLSPMLHSAEARAQGLENFQYELIDLEDQPDAAQRLGEIIREHVAAGFTGFNVTHPHKQHVIKYLDGLSDTARILGAVNNVIHTDDGWVAIIPITAASSPGYSPPCRRRRRVRPQCFSGPGAQGPRLLVRFWTMGCETSTLLTLSKRNWSSSTNV
jgi:hypothetical protein